MNIRPIGSFILGVFSLLYTQAAQAQTQPAVHDCDFDSAANVQRSRQQAISDSIDLATFVPAAPKQTMPCAIPAVTMVPVEFNLQNDRIYGFFNGIDNANEYLVVLNEENTPLTTPINGMRYKAGNTLGAGLVVSLNPATAFAALNLKPLTAYTISIYAANDNCASGIQYNTVPVYSAVMKTTGSAPLNRYYGNLHSHSSYSDGNQDNTNNTPADNYAFAKDAMCMDFLGIAEHNHYSYPHNPGMHVADYQPGINAANTFTANNSNFLALYGMEFGVIDNGGHVVVYGIDSLLGWETLVGSPNYNIFVGKYDYTGSNGLFNTVNRFKSNNAFATLAHPNDEDYSNLLGLQYQAFVDSALIGCALENGPAFSTETNYDDYPSTMSYLSYYKKLLAKGYRMGPTMDHDNHNLTFGRTARSRLVVMSPSLAKDDFMKSMRSLSFYATHSCTAVLDFQIFGNTMGTEIQHAGAPAMVITISDASVTQQPTVRIYKGTNNGAVASIVATGYANSFSYTDDNLTDGTAAYYFTDISMGQYRTISAPIWYNRNDNPSTAIKGVQTADPSLLMILENPVTNGSLQYRLNDNAYGQKDQLNIVDMYGRIMITKTVTNNGSVNSLNIANLPAGVYVLNITSAKGRYLKKFIKD